MLRYGFQRLTHSLAQPAPLATAINHHFSITLPENHHENNSGSHFIDSPFSGGAMELMAVPKRKVSPHRRGIRNGPKALKPVPVIIKCKVCGRVKLPHFFCCSGIKPNPEENNN